jgi:MFS family permease
MLTALTLCVAIFSVNWTVLNAAQVTIIEHLSLSPSSTVWLIYAFPAALLGVLIPVKGRLSVLLYGLAAFGLVSVVGAVAVSGGMLIACRFGQGLAAAIVLRAGFELTKARFRGTRWWPALVIPLVVVVLGQIAGPVIGLIIVDYFSYRWIFLVSVPLVLVAMAAVALCTPRAVPLTSGDPA